MKYIFKAIFIVLAAIIGFTYIAIMHVLNIIWAFELNPITRWRNEYGQRTKGKFTQRYEAWQKIIEASPTFESVTVNIDY